MLPSVDHFATPRASAKTSVAEVKTNVLTPSVAPATNVVAYQYQSTTSTRVEITGGSASLVQQRVVGVAAYQAVEEKTEALNPFANTILRFIDAQLRRDVADGASKDDLQSRLQAGLDGFEEGYGAAYAQLTAGGLLPDNVQKEIESTRTQVLAGLQKLADELGVELTLPDVQAEPEASTAALVPAMPVADAVASPVNPGKTILSSVLRDVQIIEQYQKAAEKVQTYTHLGRTKPAGGAHSYAYGVQESRDFSLKLRTADGDAVTIRMSASQAGYSRLTGAGGSAQLALYGEQQNGFTFAVDGELDETELVALTELMDQVAGISEQFFAGDLDRAFELASTMTFDRSEIAAFDLSLNMSRTEMAEAATARSTDGPFSALDDFSSKVLMAADFAESLGQPRSLVADLLDWVARSTHAQDPRSAFLAPAARAIL